MLKINYLIQVVLLLACTVVQAQLHKGDSLYGLGDYNEAIEAYALVQNADVKIARSFDALGNTTKALRHYTQAIKTGDTSLLTRYNYGKLLLKADRFKIADSLFKLLSKESPENPEFLYLSALAKDALNDSTALITYMKVVRIDSLHLNAQYKLARHFTTKRNFLMAEERVAVGLAQDPNSTRFINLNALIYFYSKNYHGAVKHYEKLIALNQSNEQLHNNLAISYAKTNQFLKAIDQYNILIEKFNDQNPTYYFNLGKMYQAEQQMSLAVTSIKRAIALQDVPLDMQYLTLATIYKKDGDYKNTFLMIEKAVQENSNDELLRYQYAVAADNYYKDALSVIKLYEAYLERYGTSGRYSELVKQRITDIKTNLHFENKE